VKKLIETIKNIWSIDELRTRILFTLGLILVYRVGVQIVLPGINPNQLADIGKTQNGLLGLLNSFAGGAFNNASIFALGIMPYISASIAMQLLQIAVPSFKKLGSDESGRRKLNMYTRYLTIAVTVFQAVGYITYLNNTVQNAIIENTLLWKVMVVFTLTAGTLFVMWMGEKITEKGIGNGTSLIIMAGIIARLIPSLILEWNSRAVGGGVIIYVIEIVAMLATILGIIVLTQGTRRIPLNYARRTTGATTLKDVSGTRDFIPLKVNMANVMPIIFAQAILFIPGTLLSGNTASWAMQFKDPTSLLYNIAYVILVIAFTFFYTALIMNPTQMSDDLKRNNGFIPGVKPGEDTASYIGTIIDRITLPGAVILALIGILPSIARLCHITSDFSNFFGGTSMLIMVGVILDTLQQVESKLLEKQYDGLMQSGRISGRTPISTPTAVAG
jgi:preprotein translocase subunit SecY